MIDDILDWAERIVWGLVALVLLFNLGLLVFCIVGFFVTL